MAKGGGSCSTQDQVPILRARINELEEEIKEMDARRAAKMKEMKGKQDAMFRLMSMMKEQLPSINLSNIFNGVNMEAANDSCSAFEHRSNVNPTLSHSSRYDGSRNKGKR